MFRDYSISKKLTRMNMLVSGAALLLACGAFITYDVISIRDGMVYNLSMQAQIVGFNSTSALLFNDPHSAENTLSGLKAWPNIVSAGINTLDGRPFATYQRGQNSQTPAMPPILAGQVETYRFNRSEVVLVRRIVFQDKPTGIVYIQSDLEGLKVRVAQYLGVAAAVLVVSLLAVLLISPVFRRAIAEPIVHLAVIARAVSRDKDYSVRATPTGNRDELSILVDDFNDMLNLSRVTRSAIRREKLDLSAVAKSIATELREAEPDRRVEFVIESDLNAVGDSQLVRTALENLLRNSWKYTSGHLCARIEFGKSRQNGKFSFFVRDDGAGFDPRYAGRLFGAFQRLPTAKEIPGTGVGLATVQRIIHRHGGEIWAEGAVEKGATFYFTL